MTLALWSNSPCVKLSISFPALLFVILSKVILIFLKAWRRQLWRPTCGWFWFDLRFGLMEIYYGCLHSFSKISWKHQILYYILFMEVPFYKLWRKNISAFMCFVYRAIACNLKHLKLNSKYIFGVIIIQWSSTTFTKICRLPCFCFLFFFLMGACIAMYDRNGPVSNDVYCRVKLAWL